VNLISISNALVGPEPDHLVRLVRIFMHKIWSKVNGKWLLSIRVDVDLLFMYLG